MDTSERNLEDLIEQALLVSRTENTTYKPATKLNPELENRYPGNVFSVIRQLHFSTNSVDLAIFLNGLPIFTAKLKNDFKAQTVEEAIDQYRKRDIKEPLFIYGRCLAHFAVDPQYVYMTTQLQGEKTRFLPFNQGYNGGAGNPPNWKSFATSYLWECIFSRVDRGLRRLGKGNESLIISQYAGASR